MYLLRTPRSRGLCVSPTALIALLLITCSAEATPLRDGGLKRGLGANGDLVIHITGATGATCALNYFSILSINTTLCRNHSDAFVLAPTTGVKILTAGSAYHITKTSMESAFRAQGCSEFLSEEVRVSGTYCVNHGVGLTISGFRYMGGIMHAPRVLYDALGRGYIGYTGWMTVMEWANFMNTDNLNGVSHAL